jgi:ferredoxin
MTPCTYTLSVDQFDLLLSILKEEGYKVLGPKVQNGVIILDTLTSSKNLPIGWMDEQSPGKYELKKRKDDALFGYNLGPHSWKQFLFPPKEKLFTAKKIDSGFVILEESTPPTEKMAFIGVRGCELAAIHIQDRVFYQKPESYPQYQKRKESLFIVAVNCTRSVATCFCTAMGSGPRCEKGYDISLTEVITTDEHLFTLTIGSEKGRALVEKLHLAIADEKQKKAADKLIEDLIASMLCTLNPLKVHDTLMKSWDCKRWDNVAKRCVGCANCTLVCPTCFCSDTKEKISLDGSTTERWQQWESCFNLSHSQLHGGSIRHSSLSRYRQWLTHKFGTWWEQFGLSGCVGCGRCITWCPVGIDVREELNALESEVDENSC